MTPALLSDTEAWRPRYHYTPSRHWMNDPNGLHFFGGEYHLYYQYNPEGSQWGNISWGHAVSPDLVSWQELPVAIAASDRVMAFSGSVVVDHLNSAGFAEPGDQQPVQVACFTGFDPVTKIQSQHLAYSRDRGRSYTAYAGNPVIDIGSKEFRDPKVFWHAPSNVWVMLVVASLQQELWIYHSTDLKQWRKVSTFGPAGSAANNIWEVPELFELPVDGDAAKKRWVLVISVNHGALWGGSGVQYFIGDFDGSRFTADGNEPADGLTLPDGDWIADFEGGHLPAGWQMEGDAFGAGPVPGALDGQAFVSGHLGRGLMNSGHGGDANTGSLTSPPFTLTRPCLNFQIAGGNTDLTRLELWVDGQVVQQTCGDQTTVLKWRTWDVSALVGRQAVLRAVDESTGPGGHLLIDNLVMTDQPVTPPSIADITLWADHGRDFYAPISFANMPDGRVLWLGWMANWDYARVMPTVPWRGQQSGVRELDLVSTPRGLRLRQRVVKEQMALIESEPLLRSRAMPATQVAAALNRAASRPRQLMARLVVPTQGLQCPIGLELFKGATGSVKVGFDPACNSFFIDRRTETPEFPGHSERHDGARLLDADEIMLEIWIDGSMLEVFADGGSVVLSDLVYAAADATGVGLFHGDEDPMVGALDLHAVRATVSHLPNQGL